MPTSGLPPFSGRRSIRDHQARRAERDARSGALAGRAQRGLVGALPLLVARQRLCRIDVAKGRVLRQPFGEAWQLDAQALGEDRLIVRAFISPIEGSARSRASRSFPSRASPQMRPASPP